MSKPYRILPVAVALMAVVAVAMYALGSIASAEAQEAEADGAGDWVVASGDGVAIKTNRRTGESYVLQRVEADGFPYWQPVADRAGWRQYAYLTILLPCFSEDAVEVLRDDGKSISGFMLKSGFKDPGLGFRPGDVITKVNGSIPMGRDHLCSRLVSEDRFGICDVRLKRDGQDLQLMIIPRLLTKP